MLQNVNALESLTNDQGQMTNDDLLLWETLREHQLAIFAPTYLSFNNFNRENLFIEGFSWGIFVFVCQQHYTGKRPSFIQSSIS